MHSKHWAFKLQLQQGGKMLNKEVFRQLGIEPCQQQYSQPFKPKVSFAHSKVLDLNVVSLSSEHEEPRKKGTPKYVEVIELEEEKIMNLLEVSKEEWEQLIVKIKRKHEVSIVNHQFLKLEYKESSIGKYILSVENKVAE